MNKDLSFIKGQTFFNKGIYDNSKVYENTTKAITNAIKSNVGVKIDLKMTQDNVVICYSDNTLERLVHVEDKVSDCTFENINYITKFPILQLSEVIELTKDIPVIFELDKNNTEYKLKIMDILTQYEGKYAIISKDLKTLKWMSKNYPKVVTGYKIDKDNMYRFHIFKKYDFLSVDVNIYNDKYIRKQREDKFIIGHNVIDANVYNIKKTVYDALICESKFD